MKSLVVALSLLTLSAPVFAQSGSSEGQAAIASDASAERAPADAHRNGETNAQGERLICRMTTAGAQQSSSHMGMRRVCHTQAEWRAIAQEAAE